METWVWTMAGTWLCAGAEVKMWVTGGTAFCAGTGTDLAIWGCAGRVDVVEDKTCEGP